MTNIPNSVSYIRNFAAITRAALNNFKGHMGVVRPSYELHKKAYCILGNHLRYEGTKVMCVCVCAKHDSSNNIRNQRCYLLVTTQTQQTLAIHTRVPFTHRPHYRGSTQLNSYRERQSRTATGVHAGPASALPPSSLRKKPVTFGLITPEINIATYVKEWL